MINMMNLTSTLPIFRSFPATYHLALLMVCTFHCSLDMHDAAQSMMNSDITTSQDLIEKYQRSVNVMVSNSFPG